MAKIIHTHTDALPLAERRRCEALLLAIAMAPGRYPEVGDYLRDAEEVERWIAEASAAAPPLAAYEEDVALLNGREIDFRGA